MALTKIDDRGLKTPIDLLDDEKIRFGTGNDLEVYHSGTNTFIANSTGPLKIRSDVLELGAANGEQMLQGTADAAVNLYHNGIKKLETTSSGISVSGSVSVDAGSNTTQAIFSGSGGSGTRGLAILTEAAGAADEGVIFNARASGTTATIKFQTNGSTALTIQGEGDEIDIPDDTKLRFGDGQDLLIYHDPSGNGTNRLRSDNVVIIEKKDSEDMASFTPDGAVALYYDGSKKFETTSTGAKVTGYFNATGSSGYGYVANDDIKVSLGTGNDLQLYHDGTHSRIVDTRDSGTIRLQTDGFKLIDKDAGETMISAVVDGAVELYYDNVKKLHTTSAGVYVTATNTGSFEIKATDIDSNGPYFKCWNSDSTYGGGIQQKNNNALGGIEFLNSSGAVSAGFYNSTGGWHWGSNLILDGSGIRFNGDTAAANELDDYEEGTLNWRLKKEDASDDGSNNSSTVMKYTKVGDTVYISGYIRTDSTESNETGNIKIVDITNPSNAGSLPFTPNHNGVLFVGHTRTVDELSESICIAFNKDNTSVAVFTNDGTGQYTPYVNNVSCNSQTNLAITFEGVYHTNQ